MLELGAFEYEDDENGAAQAAKDLTSKDYIVRRFAAARLNRFGPLAEPHIKEIGAALLDEDAGVRLWVAATIAGLGPAATVEHMSELVQLISDMRTNAKTDRDEFVHDCGIRYWAIVALGVAGAEASVHLDVLKSCLNDDDPQVRVVAMEAISLVEPDAVPSAAEVVRKGFDDQLAVFRAGAATALSYTGLAATPYVQALGETLKDNNARAREAAAKTLGGLGVGTLKPFATCFAEMVKSDPDSNVRSAADGNLRLIGFEQTLAHQDIGVRLWAAKSLADKKSLAAGHGPALATAIKDADPMVRYWATIAYSGSGCATQEDIAVLKEALEDKDPQVRVESMKLLVKIDPEQTASAVQVISRSLKHKKSRFRARAADALSEAGLTALPVAAQIAELLDDPNWRVRTSAANSLQCIGKAAVLPSAKKLAGMAKSDEDVDVRRVSKAALSKFGLAEKFGLE